MRKGIQSKIDKNYIINASDIGQYHYCSKSWFLQKCGYKPESDLIDKGIKKHIKTGKILDELKLKNHKYRAFAICGYLLFCVAIIIILLEVILLITR